MDRALRDEFWRRLRAASDRYLEGGTPCEIHSNTFDVRRWDMKFVARDLRTPRRAVTISLLEHAPSTASLLVAMTRECEVDGREFELDRQLIPVFFDEPRDRFALHADHGPVDEAMMPEYFAGMAMAILHRL